MINRPRLSVKSQSHCQLSAVTGPLLIAQTTKRTDMTERKLDRGKRLLVGCSTIQCCTSERFPTMKFYNVIVIMYSPIYYSKESIVHQPTDVYISSHAPPPLRINFTHSTSLTDIKALIKVHCQIVVNYN